ncbi:MAG: hypothetical protein ACKOU6_10945 [Planctomycetota bacterium]
MKVCHSVLRGRLVLLTFLMSCSSVANQLPADAKANESVCAATENDEKPAATVLNVAKATKKLEVRVSQIGYRDTLLFYTFEQSRIILKFQIGNQDKKFPMTGTIYVFAADVTLEQLEKWLNNQHSDALFPDVPKPIAMHQLPANTCQVTEQKLLDRGKFGLGEFENYDVQYTVKDFADKTGIQLKGFSGTTKVHIPVR